MIGCIIAPNFNGINPQGVLVDSLGGLKVLGAWEVPERARVPEPHPWFSPFEASHTCGMGWNDQRGS
jgi:hypothetical protein